MRNFFFKTFIVKFIVKILSWIQHFISSNILIIISFLTLNNKLLETYKNYRLTKLLTLKISFYDFMLYFNLFMLSFISFILIYTQIDIKDLHTYIMGSYIGILIIAIYKLFVNIYTFYNTDNYTLIDLINSLNPYHVKDIPNIPIDGVDYDLGVEKDTSYITYLKYGIFFLIISWLLYPFISEYLQDLFFPRGGGNNDGTPDYKTNYEEYRSKGKSYIVNRMKEVSGVPVNTPSSSIATTSQGALASCR